MKNPFLIDDGRVTYSSMAAEAVVPYKRIKPRAELILHDEGDKEERERIIDEFRRKTPSTC